MKNNMLLRVSALAIASVWAGSLPAVAGGVERSTQSALILFESGDYAEFSLGIVSPEVSGSLGGGALPSGDMATSYFSYSFGIKKSLSDNLDMAVIFDQPIGADTSYPVGTGYPFQGATATIRSMAVTGLLKYRFENNVSLFGGLRAQSVKGDVAIPLFGYTMTTDTDYRLGYVVGAAWERPDIAARVALTYNSEIVHTLDALEAGVANTQFDTEIPASVNLEFQTGIAENTLLFGSVRYVDWSKFDITPPLFGSPLVDYSEDTVSYSLGIGRRFNDQWSGAVTFGYEAPGGGLVGNLGPTDGYTSIGVGATYTQGNMEITGGVRYVLIGDATTSTIGADFTDNTAIGAGLRIGYSF